MTPFQALYGYDPPEWKELALSETKVPTIKDHPNTQGKLNSCE